jgi:hypothetical protein
MSKARKEKDFSILYISGFGRSGSTLLDRILGQVDGFFPVGELRNVPERFYLAKWSCGCGKPLRDCRFWAKVFDKAFGGYDNFMADRFFQLREMNTRPLRMLSMAAGWPHGGRAEAYAREYVEMIDALYSAIAEVSGSSVLVDSTKFPSQGYIYARYGKRPIRFVHLVRDPRAVAFSWQRPKVLVDSPDQRTMYTYPVLKTALHWDYMNIMSEILPYQVGAKSMRLRYEDLVETPSVHLKRVLDFAGANSSNLPLQGERTVVIESGDDHTMSGNPNRMTSGELELKLDDQWREKASRETINTIQILTAPLMLRYGYFGRS